MLVAVRRQIAGMPAQVPRLEPRRRVSAVPVARWMAGRSSLTGALFPTAMGKCRSALIRPSGALPDCDWS
ncbi:hypothetical protein SAZ11_04960 [Streptomyces sp. FXJ1.4098]|nr:hypothetical protein [Streptomyces sp. FXJ1.4098]